MQIIRLMLFRKYYFFFAALFFFFAQTAVASDCHPAVNITQLQYIVGYGSLIQTNSKEHSYKGVGKNIPVMVHGYQRGWFSQGIPVGFGTTFLGVKKNPQAQFNGVIFSVPAAALPTFDKREMNYCRQEVSPQDIKMLVTKPLPKAQYWIYMPQENAAVVPSEKYPMVQSYVDIFLVGCFEMQEKYNLQNYANECVDFTSDWSSHWVNDRIMPRRPWVAQPEAVKIDQLLKQKLPQLFQQIKIE